MGGQRVQMTEETLPKPVRAKSRSVLAEEEVLAIEKSWPNGLTSRQIIDAFETRGVRFSEATLRKYVQIGLLPRSVRVGRKGKHKGSCGIYPANVVRRVNVIRQMMADNLTIEEIQKSFLRFKDDIDSVESGLRDLIASFEKEAQGQQISAERRAALESEIEGARKAAGELVRRISGLERRLTNPSDAFGPAVGGGMDLY